MQPNPSILLDKMGLKIPLVGFYDAPDTTPFEPILGPKQGTRVCMFAFYKHWLNGKTAHFTKDNYGCGGAGHWIFGLETREREAFVKFLVDDEGLKASHELMEKWLDFGKPYQAEHGNILIGPLKESQYDYLKTITFFVNPDQMALLSLGAQYYSEPGDPIPTIASFGSGCMELAPLFEDLNAPQAIIGSTDIAMRQYLPHDIIAYTVTKSMFERLCSLDEKSFLYKPFWKNLQKARGLS